MSLFVYIPIFEVTDLIKMWTNVLSVFLLLLTYFKMWPFCCPLQL